MINLARFLAWMSAVALGMVALAVTPACAQTEFAPAAGKGRLVVVLSGHDGASHYMDLARQIAQLGYDAVLFDGNAFCCRKGEALRAAIVTAQRSEHALPGKVAVVGFSLGGADALAWATQWPDLVATVVAWVALELVTYPNVNHDFVRADKANRYDSRAATDAWQRQTSRLKLAFSD